MKIVINTRHGGFGLSREAFLRLREMNNEAALLEADIGEENGPDADFMVSFCRDIERDDPDLIKVVEELGVDANTPFSDLKIVEIPDDVIGWKIEEYAGLEWITETHRTWS